MIGLYSLNSADQLFEKMSRDFTAFDSDPTIDRLYNVLFPLYHLREWICPGRYKAYQHKSQDLRSPAERFATRLHAMPEYKIVADLCNHAKHLSKSDLASRTEELDGFRVSLGRCGDSLGVTHFLVDNREIRDVFWAVYLEYFDYFRPGVRQTRAAVPSSS